MSNSTLADTSNRGALKGALKPYLRMKVQSPRESDALENGFRELAEFDGAEVCVKWLQIPRAFPWPNRDRERFAKGWWRREWTCKTNSLLPLQSIRA
jgi:hypothetical protein